MKKNNAIIIGILCCMLITSSFLAKYDIYSVVSNTQNNKIIVIDVGHGGIDPGKVGVNNSLEKNINLEIALRVKALLKDTSYTVILTREDDNGLYCDTDSNKKSSDMKNRIKLITESNADIVISIHQNSYTSESARGAQVFYYSTSHDGKTLADIIQNNLKRTVDETNTRLSKANNSYYMLINSPCPAVIVECGFLSNWEEANKLGSEDYQKKIAQAIKDSIDEYFEKK